MKNEKTFKNIKKTLKVSSLSHHIKSCSVQLLSFQRSFTSLAVDQLDAFKSTILKVYIYPRPMTYLEAKRGAIAPFFVGV